MLKIIICDDNDFTVRLIHGLLEKAIEISKTEAWIVCKATSGADVLNYIHKNADPYLYFLEFGRKELNGIDLAKKIYQYDTNGKIIFVTSHGEMLMYGKEASNKKQEIDRQHHTIPNQRIQRPKDKHCGISLIHTSIFREKFDKAPLYISYNISAIFR